MPQSSLSNPVSHNLTEITDTCPQAGSPFNAFLSSKCCHQNTTPPSALCEFLVCGDMSIPRVRLCFPRSKPAGRLGKEKKPLPSRRAHVTQDSHRTLCFPSSLYGGAGSQTGSPGNFWGSAVANSCQSMTIRVRETAPKGPPARVVGA